MIPCAKCIVFGKVNEQKWFDGWPKIVNSCNKTSAVFDT